MTHRRDEMIRRRAYELWEESGRKGDPDEHWFEAERQLADVLNHSPNGGRPKRLDDHDRVKEHLLKQLTRIESQMSPVRATQITPKSSRG
jgi:Protein of unknown function (DUF2934)